jgi:hypothetical protein
MPRWLSKTLPNSLSQLQRHIGVQSESARSSLAHCDDWRRSAQCLGLPRVSARHLRRPLRNRQERCASAIRRASVRWPTPTCSCRDSQNNLLLSGAMSLITRFTVSSDLDIAALATQGQQGYRPIAPPDAPSNHVRLDVHIQSSPQLNFQNAYAKLAGDVDLRLRGTARHTLTYWAASRSPKAMRSLPAHATSCSAATSPSPTQSASSRQSI